MAAGLVVVRALCMECLGECGWTGPVPVKQPNGDDLRVWIDCPVCNGKGWKPATVQRQEAR